MSYILDALRKSDQQRRRGVPPTLMAPQTAATMPGRRVSVSYVLLASVLVGAGVMVGLLWPWQTEHPAPAAVPVTVPPKPAQKPEQDVAAQKTESAPVAPATRAKERQAPAAAKPVKKVETREPRVAVTLAPKKTAKAEPGKPGAASPGDAAQEQKVITFAELPVSIQQEMPKMAISVHAYSRIPKERLVGINDQVLREGENAAPGLLLEEITPDGMIMRYKGYRFRRGAR